MATQTPVLPVVNPSAAPTLAAVGSSDTIPVAVGGKYLLIVRNAGGSADSVVITDVSSGTGPVGATTALNPNVTVSVPATTGERHFYIDANRFRDSTGVITVTHSFTTSVTCVVYGPLQ